MSPERITVLELLGHCNAVCPQRSLTLWGLGFVSRGGHGVEGEGEGEREPQAGAALRMEPNVQGLIL